MSDIIEDVEADFVVAKIGDEEVRFAVLSAYDRAALLRNWLAAKKAERAERRARLRDDLKFSGTTDPGTILAELERFDAEQPDAVTEQTWIAFVNDALNEPDIYRVSLDVHQPGRGDELSRRVSSSIERRAKVCGLQVIAVDQPQADASGPNPQTPAVYGTPGEESSTGATPPAVYGTGTPE